MMIALFLMLKTEIQQIVYMQGITICLRKVSMQPRIEKLTEKKLIGKRLTMCFADNKTKALWQSFMPVRKAIKNSIGPTLYSVEVYDNPAFFDHFNPNASFEKWAAMEVADFNPIPDQMEALLLPAGWYAVFTHKGPASEGTKTYRYIFETWLPDSAFILDNRPHFALMGDRYKNDDAESEEEIWIPVKEKNTE